MWIVAALTLASGIVVAMRMSETLREHAPEAAALDAPPEPVPQEA
jgi:hypothetical protein